MAEKLYLGLDIGGTAIKAGICDGEGRLLHSIEGPTESGQGAERVLQNAAGCACRCVEESPYDWDRIAGVGVGVPGFLDAARGVVKFSPNLPLTNFPLRDRLAEALGKPVSVGNDANVAALGEAWGGAGRGVSSCVLYTLGTGVGGGIVVGGQVIEGFTGMGGELGHMSVVPDLEAIQCGCGKKGCLETVSSATAIVRMAKGAVERGDRTSLALIENLTAKDVFDAAKAGDEVARRIIERAAHYLGKSMAQMAVIVNPERFIIGGGVSQAGEFFIGLVRETFRKCALERAQEGVEIVAATLGNSAGIVGAAGLARQQQP